MPKDLYTAAAQGDLMVIVAFERSILHAYISLNKGGKINNDVLAQSKKKS